MNIIIVGCGKVGEAIVAQLCDEGNNITVIDIDADKVKKVAGRYDVMGVVGNGATHLVQQQAGIDSADLLIAVTGSDELNLLCCLIAKKAGNCQTVARVKDPEYSSEAPYLKDELGLAMVINPEQEAAAEIARVLRFPSAIRIETFAKGRVELLQVRVPEGSCLCGLSVRDVVTKLHADVLVCTVERGNDAYIAKADLVFEEKDVISIVASPKYASDFFRQIGCKTHAVKDAMIIGGGEIAEYLCGKLRGSGISLKIIEKDAARCNELSMELPDVTILHGDATEKSVLLEEGVARAGAFVALTNIDEENILLSMYAKSRGAGKQIIKINRIELDDVIRKLELDSIVCPKDLTAATIVRHVRAMKNTIGSNVETLYSVIPGKVEAAEFIVKEGSPIAGKPLSELKFKPNVLIAAILRGKTVLIPRGHDALEPGDAVVIVSEMMAIHDVADILR